MSVVKETQLDTTESVVDIPVFEAEAPAVAEDSTEDPLPPVPAPKAPVTLDIDLAMTSSNSLQIRNYSMQCEMITIWSKATNQT